LNTNNLYEKNLQFDINCKNEIFLWKKNIFYVYLWAQNLDKNIFLKLKIEMQWLVNILYENTPSNTN
jgi:hypothetical protein